MPNPDYILIPKWLYVLWCYLLAFCLCLAAKILEFVMEFKTRQIVKKAVKSSQKITGGLWLHEGICKKGGTNKPTTVPRPAPPQAMAPKKKTYIPPKEYFEFLPLEKPTKKKRGGVPWVYAPKIALYRKRKRG